ncbi:hypothetical protein O3G_MSEX011183 [Manduca sexta]|uniref:Uncharacterized protein n=1 Tax=Manduca sexta TaxID=7130 RepID=A0A922CUQ7_MANSE|nr:hypothetical protein O3G_MSEX011183 [Manduca sexta]
MEEVRALPLGASVANGGEHLRLWRADLSGDIREPGGSLAASLLLAAARGARRAGGIRSGPPASLTSSRSPRSCVRTSPVRDVRSLPTVCSVDELLKSVRKRIVESVEAAGILRAAFPRFHLPGIRLEHLGSIRKIGLKTLFVHAF